MKPLSLAILVSAAVNIGLLVALLQGRTTRPVRYDEQGPGLSAPASQAVGETAAAPLWRQLNADAQPITLIARLKRAGFPPAVVRQVAIAVVSAHFDAERDRIDAASLNTPFWKKWPETYLDPKVGPQLRRLAREQEAMLKQVLGEDAAVVTEEQRAWAEQRYGNLDLEKRRRVEALEREYQEKNMQWMSGGAVKAFLPADAERLRATEREMHAKLAEFLSPQELTEYQQRNGQVANTLKYLLGPSEVSESEFRALLPLYQRFTEQFPSAQPYGNASQLSAEQAAARNLAADALSASIASAFGTARAEELKLALNPQYAHVARLTNRLNLPAATTRELHVAGVAAVEQIDRLNADKSLTTEQRNARLQAVGKEGADRIAAVLRSEDAIRAYHMYTHSWLLNLGKPKP